MGKTIIVSNRLPVKLTSDGDNYQLTPSEGGLATALNSIFTSGENLWIGWPGMELPDNARPEITEKLRNLSLKPIYLSQDEINLFYEGFSNEILWPVFHYASSYARYKEEYWESYRQVNQKFCDAILEVAEPEDTIWIHDYQLLLLPDMVRRQLPQSTIGFFQHIPFPSYEVFRLIPWRDQLLEGMIGSDLIGFHTFEDARHFISSCNHILPVQNSANVITVNNRQVTVEVFPLGVDFDRFNQLVQSPDVIKKASELKHTFNDAHIILTIDRLDYSKGIVQRLQAFDLFLELHPEYAEKINLYMIVVPSRDNVQQYRDLKNEIDQLVGNINAKRRTMQWHPIQYFYQSFDIETLSALYSTADVCLVTPMRDGMNLVSKEYVASRVNNTGVLILSEMAGASKELVDAIIVNPNNIGEVSRAIEQAITMTEDEQMRRMEQMRGVTSKFNVKHWVKIFFEKLTEVKANQASMLAKYAGKNIVNQLNADYRQASSRALFLDYDGTLVGFNADIQKAAPDDELYAILTGLASDVRNKVVLISGRDHKTLENWFGHLQIDMIAEHGAWQKYNYETWVKLPTLYDSWKSDLYPVLEIFTDRTPGSFIEEKSYSLVWHYRKVEKELGELRANELMNSLRLFAADKGLQMLPGNKIIEIKNAEVNKGRAALNWISEDAYDFMLALGDDHTDEDIFKELPASSYTIRIGGNISAARFYLSDFRESRALLKVLAEMG
ncbi:bifunctional alpha,alpha-trehalose-phosphate synthase (UDP-forming)/trehalose-phosphatase [Pedobacter sp. HMF7647]|uniref:Bifunctional alpha,alpha-trehalose-phosphate synthase (UDP-forming)/trehalose-phosphatase n=1 Tax=Hufsiella arboris TaxID=2695275 RepID=A0A7K1Y8P8_9SPHI|nr:bifunctional alpha,alpha-trehalose-phosphate synthase (UDP-forming)/trehalose-phosphatase [Hufsiella arboris]MXV50955.1 bifunctional alpha,alpha-trehalose-phosphate synthase (UDP-forming)/trehalose-phosphatase [Hufsiella arboris]